MTVRRREPATSGSVKVYTARFEFSPDWGGMERVAVFKAGTESRSILLDNTNTCDIPWEVLVKPNIQLQAGVCGTRGGQEVLPTIWADLGTIQPGVTIGRDAEPPTLSLWEQELAQKQDKLHGRPGQVVGFNEKGEAVAQDAAGGDGKYVPALSPPYKLEKDGLSAYQIAVENGFEGTEAEWLESLHGRDGIFPTVSTAEVVDGTTVTMIDAAGEHSFEVLNGKDTTINGENTVEIVAGENVSIEQQDLTLTISATVGSDLISGDGINIENGAINVITPVEGIFSQSEFDALPEEQKNKGMYIIPDDEFGGSGSDGRENTCSTEETRIETWIDGKPLYRRCFHGTSPSANQNSAIGWYNDDIYIVNCTGTLFGSNNSHFPLPFVCLK